MFSNLKHTGIKKIVSRDALRPSMNYVRLDPEKKRVIATDGHILLEAPVEIGEGDTEALLPVEAFDTRNLGERGEPISITVNGEATITKGSLGERRVALPSDVSVTDYPKTDAVWPSAAGRQPVLEMGMDLQLVKNICDAIPTSDKRVILKFYGPSLAVEFATHEYEPSHPNDEPIRGMIMPFMIDLPPAID